MATTRIRQLDALRGFAVCGIMLVNTWQHSGTQNAFIESALQGRFYPVFSALFGVSFVLIMRTNSRWVLLRRLFWLLCFGLVQNLYYDGEVLTHYALWGMGLLLPASFMPGFLVLPLSLGVLAWGVWAGGGALLIPGLLLLGMAIMELRPGRIWLAPAFAVSAAASVALLWTWSHSESGSWTLYTLACLTGAAAYATGFLLLPGTGVFEPLGRMALTNYITGTLVIALTDGPVLLTAGVTIAVQAVACHLWLARFRYGPLEWVWRCLTHLHRVSNTRIKSDGDEHRAVPDPGLP
ncbi:DUF418 domain-containing protein [Thermoactinospora rubra]|uniref:DUF418 domain-containing protein n=1 Tax=Thermoactinospora rubra TaxID=1088767 RepID=UPI000A0FBCD0|nr:DUF418 domain-containing protein [Thermoactinospora rubra]